MSLLTGLTQRTVENLQLNVGVLTTAYTKGGTISPSDIIGATRGGGSFTVVPTMHQVSVDGAPTYVKGLERIDDFVVTLSTTLIEYTPGSLKLALGGGASAETSGTTGDTTITATRVISASDYSDIYWIGDTSDGAHIVIRLKNGLNNSGLSLTFNDRGEGTYAISIIGHYDISDLDTAPFEIIRESAPTV